MSAQPLDGLEYVCSCLFNEMISYPPTGPQDLGPTNVGAMVKILSRPPPF